MIKDLVKIRCCGVFSGVKLPVDKLPLQAPRRSLRQGDRSSAICRLLALKTTLTRILLYCLFFIASLGASSASWCAS